MSIHNPASGSRHLDGPIVVDFEVFCRKCLTEPKILGITMSGTGGMGKADREIMSSMLLRQQSCACQIQGVVKQELIVIPIGQDL